MSIPPACPTCHGAIDSIEVEHGHGYDEDAHGAVYAFPHPPADVITIHPCGCVHRDDQLPAAEAAITAFTTAKTAALAGRQP